MNQTQTRSLRKKVLSLILAVVMAVSLLPISAFASGDSKASTTASTDEFVRIFHLDCGRKYFSVKQIEELIDAASDANYTHVELAIGNDGLRFLLDDMSVTANGTMYSSEKVKTGIQTGNEAYYNAGSVNELTQSEMDEIINHAKSKNISIIPLLNSPGHMDAIIDCMETLGMKNVAYNNSKRTISLTNTDAAAFTKALIEKYVKYFASKGCKYFNMGADEYANDVSNGFAELINNNTYGNFVTYVNEVAGIIETAGMTPIAFNDGIYYNYNENFGTFDGNIVISYWTSGWGGYSPAPASFLANKGHKIINTNDAWYYVLGRTSGSYSLGGAQNGVANTKVTDIPGDNDPEAVGAMICLWCDEPSATYSKYRSNVKSLIQTLAANNESYFTTVSPAEPEILTSTGSTTLDVNGSTTLTISGVADGATVTWSVSPAGVIELQASGNADERSAITGTSVVAKAVGTGTATVTATVDGKQYSTTLTVTDPKTKDVTVAVGKTHTETVDGTNLTGNYTTEDESIATVTVTGQDGIPETTKDTYTAAKVSYGTLAGSHTSWTKTDYFYKVGDNYYPVYAKRESAYYGYYYGYSVSGSATDVNVINSVWGYNGTDTVTVYTKGTTSVPGTPASTTIVFTGVAVGTTSVKIGDVTYRIKVTDKAPDNAMTASTINLEYWITNFEVYKGTDTYTEHKRAVSSSEASSDAGIAITDIAPNHAYSFFDGTKDVYYWQAMRLDKDNKQTNASGDDETADGTTLTHIRYYGGAWQYKTVDGTWHYFASDDQLVAYYLQKTDVTEEIETYSKDWGYGTAGTTPNQSSGKGQVALTVAVVYPDGTVSPAEGSMYSTSTTIFNYWSDRDIGIVAPKNNSDYNISKITVTDGKRAKNTDENVWYTSDTITWSKKTLAAGTQWYDETEVWNKSSGTAPMVNGKNSKITWSDKNTAKLVLIYLEPIVKDSNLNVVYQDDNTNTEISRYQIVMSYNQGQDQPTFDTSLKNSSGAVIGTTKNWPGKESSEPGYLPDDAYVTNSSQKDQKIDKNLATITGISGIYASGLYEYVGADISEDGKTLTLHYNLKNTTAATFVMDFGLPLQIPTSEFGITNFESTVETVSFDQDKVTHERDGKYGHGSIDVDRGIVTYTLTKALDQKIPIPVYVTFKNDKNVHVYSVYVIPATSVYYEDSFATFTNANGTKNVAQVDNAAKGIWTKVTDGTTQTNVNQALEELGGTTNTKNVYGYDPAYAGSSKFSMGSATKVTVDANTADNGQWPTATFTFKGTGFDVISLTDNTSGAIFVDVYKGTATSGNSVKSYAVNNYYSYKQNENGQWVVSKDGNNALYQIPVMKVSGLDYGEYTAVIRVAYSSFFDQTTKNEYNFWLDAIRVYDPMGKDNATYGQDNEGYPQYIKLRDSLVGGTATAKDGSVFIDGADKATIDQYKNGGPNNEVYLAYGQAISFTIPANTNIASIQIGAKAPNGTANMTVNNTGAVNGGISTATEMYYKLDVQPGQQVTISNTGDGILSLTNLKITFKTNPNATVTLAALSDEDQANAVAQVRALFAAPAEPFNPDRFDASWSRNVRKGETAKLTVKTSEDVEAITVNGETIDSFTERHERTGWGWWAKTVTYREFIYTTTADVTRDYTVCAVNAAGVRSEEKTATLTVRPSVRDWLHGIFGKWF